MNKQTWKTLQSHGVTEETELRLDFAYEAPNAEAANELAALLQAETDYDVHADASSVTGSTQPTRLSEAILDEWVRWMVVAGHEYGHCKFDGWGAAVP
jgi:hypothetical protein